MKNKESILEIDEQRRKEMAFMDKDGNNFFSEKISLVMDFSPYIEEMEEPRYTPEYRIVYLKEGTAVHSINYEDYSLKGGDIFLVSPYNIVSLKRASENSVHQMLAIDMPELQYMKIPAYKPIMVHLSDSDKEIVEHTFGIINNIVRSRGPQNNILEKAVMLLVNMIIDVETETSRRLEHKRLSRDEEITEDFKTILTTEDVVNRSVKHYSDIIEITDTYLSTIIKKVTGKTVMYWIDQKTVYYSKLMLQNKEVPLETVAIQSGFKTLAQFCRFFKTKTGITPTEYRNGLKKLPY